MLTELDERPASGDIPDEPRDVLLPLPLWEVEPRQGDLVADGTTPA